MLDARATEPGSLTCLRDRYAALTNVVVADDQALLVVARFQHVRIVRVAEAQQAQEQGIAGRHRCEWG